MNNERSHEGIRENISGRRNKQCQNAKIRTSSVCLRTKMGPAWAENGGENKRGRR